MASFYWDNSALRRVSELELGLRFKFSLGLGIRLEWGRFELGSGLDFSTPSRLRRIVTCSLILTRQEEGVFKDV